MARARALIFTCGVGCVWIGCNLLLGNETATFSPRDDGGGEDVVERDTTDAPKECTRTDLDTNPQHCGACDHDCFGGACFMGRCQSVVIANLPNAPNAIAVDDTYVYWTTQQDDTLRRLPIAGDGGAGEILYTNGSISWGGAIAVTSSTVVFGDNKIDGGLYGCAVSGCAAGATTILAHLQRPTQVRATPAGEIVWLEASSDGGIGRCTFPCTGAVSRPVVGEDTPIAFWVTGSGVFWSVPPFVRGRSNGMSVTLSDAGVGFDITATDERVYFAKDDAGILTVPTGGGETTVFAPVPFVAGIATDGKDVYFAERVNGGRILRCPVAGCSGAPTELAKAISTPASMIVDAKNVYWFSLNTGIGSFLMRVAK